MGLVAASPRILPNSLLVLKPAIHNARDFSTPTTNCLAQVHLHLTKFFSAFSRPAMSVLPATRRSLRIIALPLTSASRTPDTHVGGHLTYYHFMTPPARKERHGLGELGFDEGGRAMGGFWEGPRGPLEGELRHAMRRGLSPLAADVQVCSPT